MDLNSIKLIFESFQFKYIDIFIIIVPSCSSGFVGSNLQECSGCVINLGKEAEYHCIEYEELEKMARRYGITGPVDKQFCIKHDGIDCSGSGTLGRFPFFLPYLC